MTIRRVNSEHDVGIDRENEPELEIGMQARVVRAREREAYSCVLVFEGDGSKHNPLGHQSL
jgi:hypothetical protein